MVGYSEVEVQSGNLNRPQDRLTPLEAIRAATSTAADLLGWQDRAGSIDAGYYADIIAVSGDPLVNISELEHIKFVMKGGTVIKNEFPIH